MVQDQILFSLECLETNHVADGHCDDIANTEICSYDGGDCCGCNVNTQYCSDCQCLDPNGSGGGTTCPQSTTGSGTTPTATGPTTAPPSTYTSGTATATTTGCNTGWIADNYCDDINNNMECSYDGGDCCGCNVVTWWCTECLCLDPNGSGGGTTCSQPTTGIWTPLTTPVPTTTGTTVPPVPGSFGNSIEDFYSKDYKVILRLLYRREQRNS